MLDQMLELLKETAVFMLAGQMMLQFLPGKKYLKYGKMMVALLVLSQLVLPVLTLGQNNADAVFWEKLQLQETEQALFSRQIAELSEAEETLWEDSLVQSVEEQLKEEARQAGVSVSDVSLSSSGAVLIRVQKEEAGKETKQEAKQESGQEDRAVSPVAIDPVKLPGSGNRTENPGALAAAGNVRRGTERKDLALSFARALGMQEGEVEVIELE